MSLTGLFPSHPYRTGIVYSFTDDSAGNVWVSHQEGLFHLFQERVVERIPWARLGRREPASALLHDAVQDGLWLGFRDGGVAYFKHGQLRTSYSGAEGLGEGMVSGFYVDRNGTLWAPTAGGLSRITDGHILTLTSQNGLPCNTVHWMMEDDARSVWLYLACGLVRIGWSELDAWASHPKQTIHATVFDRSDGVTSHRSSAGYNSVVAKSSDGKLWFVRNVGLSVIDPHHLAFNERPPPVHIERVTANDRIYDATNGLRLPARLRDLSIDYTALSLAAPEKVRFRYMLEGQDADWKEVVNDRHVQYSNLPPRAYRFRVVASNNSGVWNETGATLAFSIAPAYYQTRWFQALVVVAALCLMWAGYRGRVRQVARQYQRRLDERVNERMRIARELHDTLLQSFHGLLLRFQTASHLLPDRPAEAKEKLDGAIEHAATGDHRRARCRAGITVLHHRKEQPRAGDQHAGGRPRGRRAAGADRHSTWPSKARRESSIRFSVTRSTRLRRKPFAMPSGTRRPDGSRSRFATTPSNSACACVTMVKGSIRRCSPTGASRDTTACAACPNVLP